MPSTKPGDDATVTGTFGDARVSFPLRAVSCDVRRAGLLLEIGVTLAIGTPADATAPVEGHLALALPPGATVCGLALDGDGGALVPASVVEKQRATATFEREVRERRPDKPAVALAEALTDASGAAAPTNTFRTRIFPFRPGGERVARVDFCVSACDAVARAPPAPAGAARRPGALAALPDRLVARCLERRDVRTVRRLGGQRVDRRLVLARCRGAHSR